MIYTNKKVARLTSSDFFLVETKGKCHGASLRATHPCGIAAADFATKNSHTGLFFSRRSPS